MKLTIAIGLAVLLAGVLGCCVWAETYTAKISWGEKELVTFTNCISVGRCPDSKDGACQLVRFISHDGSTNDFHAWAVTVTVRTNSNGGAKQ